MGVHDDNSQVLVDYNEVTSDDDDGFDTAYEDFCHANEFDGNVSLLEFDPHVSPLEDVFMKKKRIFFSRPIQISKIHNVSDLNEIFNYNIETFYPTWKMKLRSIGEPTSWPERTSSNKLCKMLLTQQYCPYNNVCKYSHHFSHIPMCKYDYCRKTKLIGPGTFINTSNFGCKTRHKMESVHSYIWRTRHQTNMPLTLYVYQEFLKEFKKSTTTMNFKSLTIKIVKSSHGEQSEREQ